MSGPRVSGISGTEIRPAAGTPEGSLRKRSPGVLSPCNNTWTGFAGTFEETIRRLDYEKIRQAAELIHESPRIEFFGVGNSLFPCLEAAKKLTFAGKWCNARTDWDDLEVTAQSMSGTDLAFLVSYSGETRSILHFARTLKANRVKMISLTGPHPNRLEKMADIALKGHMTDCCFGNLDLCSRFPMNLLLDLVIIEYIRRWKTPSQSGEP